MNPGACQFFKKNEIIESMNRFKQPNFPSKENCFLYLRNNIENVKVIAVCKP